MKFRLGKIPVQIHPTFFILVVLLGASGGDTDVRKLLAWAVVVLVSVMLHELGHAGAGIAFGLEPRIDLHGMGGTTSWAANRALATGPRILISLAGPFAGLAVGAIVFGLARAGLLPPTPLVDVVVGQILWVNVGWGVLNLLPMLPLDGGNVMLQTLHAFTRGRGERAARIVSIVVAGAAAVLSLVLTMGWWGSLLSLTFVASNVQALRALAGQEHDAPMRSSLDEAQAALQRRDGARLLELARPVALSAVTPQVKAEALQLVAYGFLFEGRVADADAALAAMPEGYQPHPTLLELRARTT